MIEATTTDPRSDTTISVRIIDDNLREIILSLEQGGREPAKHAVAWRTIGTALPDEGTVTLNGVVYTEHQCYVEALQLRLHYGPVTIPVSTKVISSTPELPVRCLPPRATMKPNNCSIVPTPSSTTFTSRCPGYLGELRQNAFVVLPKATTRVAQGGGCSVLASYHCCIEEETEGCQVRQQRQ